MSNRRNPTRRRPLGRAAAVIALAAMLVAAWYLNRPEILAERWQARLDELPDDQIEPQVRRIAELGDAGVHVLTAMLESPRDAIRGAARAILIEEVGRWELLPAEAATDKLIPLSHSLVESSAHFDAPNRRFAADMALRIIQWPLEGADDARRSALVADCETVLALCAIRRPALSAAGIKRLDPDVHRARAEEADRSSAISTSDPRFDLDAVDSLPTIARLPGGGLPVELASLPPPILVAASPTKPQAIEPNRLPEHIVAQPLNDVAESPGLLDQAPAANQPRRLPLNDGGSGSTRRLNAQIDKRKSAELLQTGATGAAAWQRLELHEVMQVLLASDPQFQSAATAELQRRGLTGPLAELAHRAADPNPAVRQQLAESLPQLPGVDARPWLLELSYDDDPNVRATAVTLMATSGDLELLKRVQQISLDDPDDHTRAQAEKALSRTKPRN
ncbi:MAG TPA: HEAT repeat domain-containing protein [Pirellulales bacterium]|jgi:hypothetical protein|nr:HEAT repeat domain-containing protein [Pirellulales bacterium]